MKDEKRKCNRDIFYSCSKRPFGFFLFIELSRQASEEEEWSSETEFDMSEIEEHTFICIRVNERRKIHDSRTSNGHGW